MAIANPLEAVVTGYQQVDNKKFVTDVQEYLIDVDSPTGGVVKEGVVVVNVYHIGYRGRQTSLQGFTFIDTTLPQVSGLRTDVSTNGADAVEVRMSASTEVTVTVKNARKAIAAVQVDGQSRDLVLSQFDAAKRSAKAIFSSGSRVTLDTVWAMTLYATTCGATCTTACCGDSSCSQVCSCRTSCFRLVYFDDLAPKVSFASGTIGTELGGSVISVKIDNFPLVTASEEASTEVVAVFDSFLQSRVFVQSSSDAETSLQIETPEIDLNGEFSKSIVITVFPVSQPNQILNIDYIAEMAIPEISGVVLPSVGTSAGGVRITVRIKFFPFPTDVAVTFGELALPDSAVSVGPGSSKQLSTIIFETPASDPGEFLVRLVPKVCRTCGKSVEFIFKQLDATLPVVLPPVPTGGPWQKVGGETQSIQVYPFPEMHESFDITCAGKGIVVDKISIVSLVKADGGASVVYSRPSADQIGQAVCTLTVVTEAKSKQGIFSYNFFDGTVLRLARMDPPQLATRLAVYGRTLDLAQQVKLTFANFQLERMLEDVSIMLGSSTIVTVLSIKDTASCPKGSIDCDRTEITVQSPPQDVSRIVSFSMSVIDGITNVPVNVPYFTPCDYEAFCTLRGAIVDAQMLRQEPPTSEFCQLKFCVDPLSPTFPKASIVSILPREGPATGGTKVQAFFENIPAYSTDDITVVVGSGASAIYAKVLTVSNPGGTLLSSKGYLEFETPSISNTGALTQINVGFVVYVGSLTISLQETFLFTPVPLGRAVLASIRPREAFPGTVNSVIAKLTNFPFIKKTSDLTQIMAKFESQTITATAILSSTYDATLATFDLIGSTPGNRQLDIFFAAHGEARSSMSTLKVLPPPTPTLDAVFPDKGIAGREISISASVKYMLPELGIGDFVVSFNGASLEVGEPVVMTPATCQTRDCATISVPFVVPQNAVAGAGGIQTIRIASNKHKNEYLDFSLMFDPSTTPVLESIDPKSVFTNQLAKTTLKVYVSNVKANFCDVGSSCESTFVFGTGTQLTTRTGEIVGGSFAYDLRIILVKPPLAPKGVGGIVSVTVKEGSVLVSSEIDFANPTPGLAPIDSPCNSGVEITVSAMGFGKTVTSPSQLSASIGGKIATVSRIVSSSADADSSSAVFTIMAPVMQLGSNIPGTVKFSNIESNFKFECYSLPVATLVPDKAMLSGKTSSADGKSIEISIRNFPALQSSANVQVKFGTLICGGDECSVLSFTNAVETVTLVVTVPPVKIARTVIVMVDYVGGAQPPEGGDPSVVYIRSYKYSTSPFTYYVPAPDAISVLFCQECHTGVNLTSCIVVGSCAGGKVPTTSKMAISGGALTVVVENIPVVPYSTSTGLIDPTASISIQFGNYPGQLKQVLFTDETRSAYEFILSSPAEPGVVTAELRVQKDITRPTASVARFEVKMFDPNIKITCDASTGCNGPVEGGKALIITVSGIVMPAGSVSNIFTITFGGTAGSDLQLVRKNPAGFTVFRVTPPPYTCSSCTTSDGKASVNLALLYKTTGVEISETKFAYWASPKIASIRFCSTGGKLFVSFDQETNKARMKVEDTECSKLLDALALASLGTPSKCVWQSSRLLEISLASDATVIPGSKLTMNLMAGLKSSNEVSAASSAAELCKRPDVVVPPSVEIKCAETIDLCASLEVRATAVSPRPPTYIWTCKNDDYLNEFLSTQSADTVYFPPGTSAMRTMDKTYQISVSVRDFLGSSSATVVASVLKKSSPTPQIQFNPPIESTTINQAVMIKGEAVFSTCPVKEEDLAFSWRQVSGPTLPASLLTTPLPQLQIPANTLKEGSVYQIALRLGMSTDSSKSSESIFVLKTGYQGLQAALAGGASTAISSSFELLLSAAPSRDLDLVATAAQGLKFSWECKFTVNGIDDICRNGSKALSFTNTANVRVPPGILLAADFPYVFTVTVTKQGRSPAQYSKTVYIRAGAVPAMNITGTGGALRGDGSLYVSSTSRLVFNGLANKNVNHQRPPMR